MYVVKTISNGVGGYSSFPYAPPEEDGLVVRHNLFGDSGTAAAAGGRTATHEIGHWLGLYHTFNGGCGQDTCSDGDYVCDTPPAANPNFTCNLNANSCGNDNPNLPDQVRNYTEPGNGQSLPFSANFDDGVFPPTGAEIYNPDLGIQWELDSLAAHSPEYAARIDNLVNVNYGTRDEIVLPFLDLSTSNPDSTLLLTFWWAYARSDPNYSDELIVQISKDCGVNYTNILTKSGNALVTGPTQTTPFIPTAAQWRKATVNLFQYRTEEYVKIRVFQKITPFQTIFCSFSISVFI